MSVRHRAPDEASTELLPVAESQQPVDERRADLRWWVTKLLFVVVAVGVVVASVAVVLQMTEHSSGNASSADATGGDCLTWPPGEPDRATQVNCSDDHLFEVVSSQAMPTSADPADPAAEAVQQKACAQAVEHNLGSRYDPNGRFVVGSVWMSGHLMCGLQLPSNGVASVTFKGRVVDQDQSSIWATGTCLGIREGQTTDVAVDCGLPHALEITGTVDLSTKFGQAAPSTAAQDAVVRDACGAATSVYLAPATLGATGLSVRYQPIDAAGWAAGSRKVACRIGSPKDGGGWATLVRSAKDGVLVDGRRGAALPSPPPPPVVEPPPAEQAPAVEAAAPTSEEPQPSTATEVPVRVYRDTEESTAPATATAQPHLDGSEGPGPVPHMAGSELPGPMPHMVGPVAPGPGPAPGSQTVQPLPASTTPTATP